METQSVCGDSVVANQVNDMFATVTIVRRWNAWDVLYRGCDGEAHDGRNG